MEEYRKYILDRFQDHLQQNFKNYCDRHGIDQSSQQLVTFLIDQDLMSLAHVQRYTILNEFEKLHPGQTYHKSHAVNTLANRFSLSERTVWNILKYLKHRR